MNAFSIPGSLFMHRQLGICC